MSAIRGVNVGGNLFDVTDSSNVAPIELTNFATRNYAKDRCFIMIDGLLYRAMVAISSGDPIVINGNAKRTTLDEMFSAVETDSDLIAPTEDGATSSDDYAIGAQIVRSGILYKVIDDITEGDAFVVGNNIELAGSVSEQIASLNEALTNVEDVINNNGAKNLLPNTATSQTVKGITFTVNSDGSVTCQGTLEAGENFASIRIYQEATHNLKSGTYHLSGCPSTVTSEDTCINIWDSNADVKERGNGVDFTIAEGRRFYVAIIVYENLPTPITFKPMLTLASQPNSDYAHYVPYAKTNRELTELTTVEHPNSGITGVDIYVFGRVVLLRLGNATVNEGSIGSLSQYKPIVDTSNAIRLKDTNNKYQIGLISIEPTYGKISVSYYVPNTTSINGGPDGIVTGELVYMI